MDIVTTFMQGVYQQLPEPHLTALRNAPKASIEDIIPLVQRYPQCPQTLLQLLMTKVDGTYHRSSATDSLLLIPILGSDVINLPYYFLSIADMLQEAQKYTDSIDEIYGGDASEEIVEVDTRIDRRISSSERLCFAHCFNNGGTSVLYLDFHPNSGGTVGQVVRFLHDPDQYRVLAPSFEAYLVKLMEHEFDYLANIEDILEL